MPVENVVETDVLVIGGGMAGLFTAIKAREEGVDVTIIDKGYPGKTSGIQLFTGEIKVFDPGKHKLEIWMNDIYQQGEYLNNQKWTETVLKESLDRYHDLVSWGIPFIQPDPKYFGNYTRRGSNALLEFQIMALGEYLPRMRTKAEQTGVKILDRVMAGELLKQDGKVVGVIGFNSVTGDLYILKAKATVITTGGSSFKWGCFPTHYWTADGEAMAYRAGAEITGKEFNGHNVFGFRDEVKQKLEEQARKRKVESWKGVDVLSRFPTFRGTMAGPIEPTVNSEGGPVTLPIWEAHMGRGPVYAEFDSMTQGQREYVQYVFDNWVAKPGENGKNILAEGKLQYPVGTVNLQNIMGGVGIWPVNMDSATGLPGLYAAGISCGTRAAGTSYPGMGFCLTHCAVTGDRAAHGAATYAKKTSKITMSEAELEPFKKIMYAPIERQGGFSPAWVTQFIQSLTVPYFFLQIKHSQRMQAALSLIEFVNDHFVPKLKAKDTHGWRLAVETKNMAIDAEMRFRTSLVRTESRGVHYREDYPRRDDPAWLAWLKVKDENGNMKVTKELIPKEWWPDLSVPYEKRYPRWFPGE